MLKFNGPHNEATAHARFLYKTFSREDWSFTEVYETIQAIDDFIVGSPRLHKAHESAYLYFFGPESHEYWIGREITGFVPQSVREFKVFDSYRGEALSWSILEDERSEKWSIEQWYQHAEQLRSLAGEALATTWRVKLGPLEMISTKSPLKSPLISFQFFKTH